MALFGKPRAGGLMDEIRCDEPSYLIWKWHPAGSRAGNNDRENAIRWGSSLRVKDGEVAVFAYDQGYGLGEEFIEGPYDDIIKTENLPLLASVIGLAYRGGTPFQAEIYFINLARIIQVPFAVPYFDLYDPRFPDFGVPTAVRGKLSFNIRDYREFIKLHRLAGFDLNAFQSQIRDAMSQYVKRVVTNIPYAKNIPAVQIERAIGEVQETVEAYVRERFERDFGVNITAVDISAIEIDKGSDGYAQLRAVTQELAAANAKAQTEVNIQDLRDTQRINAENMDETLRIQREEAQYAQRKQTQTANFTAYQTEAQAAVGIAGAEALGRMNAHGVADISGGSGMNPAAIMAGMAMGGAVGQNMAGVMNDMMRGMNEPQQGTPQNITPPPIPGGSYHVAINGKAAGPFDMPTLTQLSSAGELTRDSLVWKQGMTDWTPAGTVQELQPLFVQKAPPVPDSIPPLKQ